MEALGQHIDLGMHKVDFATLSILKESRREKRVCLGNFLWKSEFQLKSDNKGA